jgi:hypothetical protein
MKRLLYNIAFWIGYTIIIEDTLVSWDPWVMKKYTHIVIYKYMGRFKHDNSIKLRRIWWKKIR